MVRCSAMSSNGTFQALKQAGSAVAAPEEVARLYASAFHRYGTQALWSRRPLTHPSIADVLVVAEALRREGDMAAWRLAAELEAACRSAV